LTPRQPGGKLAPGVALDASQATVLRRLTLPSIVPGRAARLGARLHRLGLERLLVGRSGDGG
jgi:hypothetical protein